MTEIEIDVVLMRIALENAFWTGRLDKSIIK